MSKLEQFFELIGVQPDVKFKLKNEKIISDSVFYFNSKGKFLNVDGYVTSCVIPEILSGEFEIVLEPFKPREDGRYWYFDTSGELNVTRYSHSCIVDVANFSMGNCFPSESIPEDKRREIGYKFEEAGVDVSGWKL